VALVNGGTDTEDNVQALCESCHDAKTRIDLGQSPRRTIGPDGWPV
jgi:5-methylcytosine-specific restriction endonuclease McrA